MFGPNPAATSEAISTWKLNKALNTWYDNWLVILMQKLKGGPTH